MLSIRPEQVVAFEAEALHHFEDEMVEHLLEFAPAVAGPAGDIHLRALIRTGIQRAEGYGFTCQGPVAFYLELMVLFGIDFDTDPQVPWAAPILAEVDRNEDELERADRLYDAFEAYADQVGGKDLANDKEALRRAMEFQQRGILPVQDSVEAYAPDLLAWLHPQKASALGNTTLRRIIAHAVTQADVNPASDSAGHALDDQTGCRSRRGHRRQAESQVQGNVNHHEGREAGQGVEQRSPAPQPDA